MKGKGKKINLAEGGDTLVGTAGADQFVLREGQGDLIVEGFDRTDGDRVLFDFSSYSDVLGPLGFLHDGQQFRDFTGQTLFTVSAVDANGDGITDTRIQANEDSITLLGVSPDSLTSAALMGG